ncbi:hypothetical protein FQB35_09915 [Crassaminicella thermophila]|uniref:Antirepressor protein ant N-terminal domain-containing protein n=1 Tax=Crassaminicella thermophila TaxID=2599308 RepID=A0A5C0SFU6_CRATE|nr:phage antirepressor N-terminal domain-containing protein [Crassaminicella thermophila]QEK12616.1 hypothetical protein FQB35_09915 [Crassaminicella thermophila]
MKNDLVVKEVNFNGDVLVAVKSNSTGKIFTGVKWICEGLGLDVRRQREKLQEHLTLKKGVSTLPLPSNGGIQNTLAIELDFLPLWLATINPALVKEEIKTKLVEYQLKAKDVLAQAFLQQSKPVCIEDVLIQSLQEMKAMRMEIAVAKEIAVTTKEEVQGIRDVIVINPRSEWRKEANRALNAIGRKLGDFKNPKDESYRALEERAKCKLSIRLKNLQSRALMNGMTKSKVDKLNNLDVIENDTRLKEIYIAIIKEMAIKYGVA